MPKGLKERLYGSQSQSRTSSQCVCACEIGLTLVTNSNVGMLASLWRGGGGGSAGARYLSASALEL